MIPFDSLELIWNGEIIASEAPGAGLPARASLRHKWTPQESGWLAARCKGDALVPARPAPQRVFAHSAPLIVLKDGQSQRARPEAVHALSAELKRLSHWAAASHLTRVAHVVEEARTVLAKKLP